ncbi:MAG TPA: hypothetical protein VGL99_13540 [Chloroflexota bacterium]
MKLPRVAGHRSFAPSVLAYGLLAVFFVGERLLRRGVEAQTLETTSDDQGTTRLIGISYAAALNAGWLAPLLSNRGWGRLSDARVQVFGLSLMVLGLVIKAWAIRTLGSFYTRTLRTKSDQPVIDSGPINWCVTPGERSSRGHIQLRQPRWVVESDASNGASCMRCALPTLITSRCACWLT